LCLVHHVGGLLGLLLTLVPVRQAAAMRLPPAIEYAVRAGDAVRAGADASSVEVLEALPVRWTDGCIGVDRSLTPSCPEAAVDGYAVWAAAGGEVFRYHTDLRGNDVIFAERGLAPGDATAADLPVGRRRVRSTTPFNPATRFQPLPCASTSSSPR
jgi:hypothetical protein